MDATDQQVLITPGVAWKINLICNKTAKIAYGPWVDRQR